MGALYGHRAIGCHMHRLRLQKESIFCEVCPARPSLLTLDLRPFDPALDPAVTLLRLLGASFVLVMGAGSPRRATFVGRPARGFLSSKKAAMARRSTAFAAGTLSMQDEEDDEAEEEVNFLLEKHSTKSIPL